MNAPPAPQPHALTAALPLPQQTELVLSRLLRHLTLYQVQTLADQLDQVLAHGGFGEVTILYDKGHVRRVGIYLTVDVSPKVPPPTGQTHGPAPTSKESP